MLLFVLIFLLLKKLFVVFALKKLFLDCTSDISVVVFALKKFAKLGQSPNVVSVLKHFAVSALEKFFVVISLKKVFVLFLY